MSDEKKMNSLLGRLFDKNKNQNGEPASPVKAAEPAVKPEDDELYMDPSLFDELLADVLADEPGQAPEDITAAAETIAADVRDAVDSAENTDITEAAVPSEPEKADDPFEEIGSEFLAEDTVPEEEKKEENPEDNFVFSEPEKPEEPADNPLADFFDESDNPDGADTENSGEVALEPVAEESADNSDTGVFGQTQNEDIEPEDAMLMSALGYSDAAPAEVRAPVRRGTVKTGKRYSDLDHALAYSGREYQSHKQDAQISAAYESEKTALLIKSAALALVAVFVFIFDVFGRKFGGAFSASSFPVVNIMVSLQLLLIAAAISYKSVFKGFMSIIKGRPAPESVSAVVVLLTVVYDILIAAAVPSSFTLYNFPAVFCLILNMAADWLTLIRETETFERLSSFDSVCTVEKLGDDSNGSAYGMRRASFAQGYFRRTNICGFPTIFVYIILFIVALALVLFFISLAAKRTFVNSLNVFITVVQFSLPSFALIAYTLPFFMMTRCSVDENAVILHETDTAGYGKVNTVVLEESDVFGANAIRIAGITSCNPGVDYFDAVAAATAILDQVGGTVSGAFRSVADSGQTVTAENVRVAENGAEGDVNGIHYIIGTGNYLEKKWIRFPDAGNRQFLSSTKGGLVLYIAADSETILRINLQYSLEPMFAGLVESIAEKDIRVILSARDPFITSAMISELLGRKDIKVSVVMANDGADEPSGKTLDAGLIAEGSGWMSAVRASEACEKYVKWTGLRFYIVAATLGLGILLSSFLGALGAVIGMSSLFIVLFQVFSVIPSVIMSRLLFD